VFGPHSIPIRMPEWGTRKKPKLCHVSYVQHPHVIPSLNTPICGLFVIIMAKATSEAVLTKIRATAMDTGDQVDTKKPKSRYHIPWPATKQAERQWQLEQMAAAFRIFAKLGFADGGSGHISVRGASFFSTVYLCALTSCRPHTARHVLDQSLWCALRSPHRL
jgi:hypothetical protein